MNPEYLIIGLDGGATKISGWTIELNPATGKFRTGSIHVEKSYSTHPNFNSAFRPVDLQTQLSEMQSGIILTDEESLQGRVYMETCLDVLEGILQVKNTPAIVGLGMPGLKTSDGRGIAALANGPRMPGFASFLEKGLATGGHKLLQSIHRLGSDADYCGLGEEYGQDGLFADLKNAYYLGGGTGVADAIKLQGKLFPFDAIKEWMAKTWEMKPTDGESLERYVSARGLQSEYAKISGTSSEMLDRDGIYGPQIMMRAINGDEAAQYTLENIADRLGRLLFERIQTVYEGWTGLFSFINPSRTLRKDHPFLGTLLDKLVIGQRLGELFQISEGNPYFQDIMSRKLANEIKERGAPAIRAHYLTEGEFNRHFLGFSKLREAPAIGAGVDAWLHYNSDKSC